MKKNQLIKALAITAVLAAFPAAGLTASAEDASADFAAINDAAPVAAAQDVVIEAAPATVEAPVVVEAAPAVDDAAAAAAEAVQKGDKDTPKTVDTASELKKTTAPVDTDTTTKATMDDVVIKAGNDTKINTTVTAGKYTVDVNKDGVIDEKDKDDKGNYKIESYKTAVRYFSSDNSIATVDNNGNVHAKKAGKVTIYVETLEGTKEIVLNVTESYNVLLIDRTTSTNGKGLAKEKAAAISFSEEVLKVNSESHVAVVQVGDAQSTKTLSTFTNNLKDIKNTINGITSGNEYSIYSAGLKQAGSLLDQIPNYNKGLNKNIVVFGDGACTYGDRAYAQDVAKDMLAKDDNLEIYAFGVYDSATDAEKKEGAEFLKSISQYKRTFADGTVAKINDKEVVEDNYYEVGNVADLKDTFKTIATRPTYTDAAKTVSFIAFDTVVYGKDCGKKSDCDKKAAAKKGEANSPETADSSSIYVIALFALLGAGVAGVSAKKRFED